MPLAMSLISRTVGFVRRRMERGRLVRARRQEALGRLGEATALYLEAGERKEALRLYGLRADHALDPAERLQLLSQALELAEEEERPPIAERRARLKLDLVRSGTLVLGSSELVVLGRELEQLGLPLEAAGVYADAGAADAQARALVAAGAVDQLEQVLDAQQTRQRSHRKQEELEQRVRDLELAGSRRRALELARSKALSADGAVVALGRDIELRRSTGPCARLALDGEQLEVAFGGSVTLGRAEATLNIEAPAVSRRHLEVRRTETGPEVLDLGSSNGTLLAGARLDVPLAVGAGVDLELGGEVGVHIEPWRDGVRVAFGGRTVHAPLGPLVVGRWSVEPSEDGWLELSAPADGAPCRGPLRLDARVQLLSGDALSEEPGGPVRLEVLA